MNIDKNILNKYLPNIITQFETENFNLLSIENKKKLINDLSSIICTSLNTKFNVDTISFVEKEKIEPNNAAFRFYENDILLNQDLLKENLDIFSIACLVNNTIHETIHYCQKQNNLYLDDLQLTLPFPYNRLQEHEMNAYNFTSEILQFCKTYMSFEFNSTINEIIHFIERMHNNCINDLSKRKYNIDAENIAIQIQTIKPFAKNINKIQELKDTGQLIKKCQKMNQFIELNCVTNNKIFGLISIDCGNNVDRLHFVIVKNECIINDISKLDINQGPLPVSDKNKNKLIDILNKIIKVGNENNFFNCDKIIINPISVVDTKDEYDAFVKKVEKNTIKTSFLNNISERQIKIDIFSNIDDR